MHGGLAQHTTVFDGPILKYLKPEGTNWCVNATMNGRSHSKLSGFILCILVNIFINDLKKETDGMVIKFLDSVTRGKISKTGSKEIATGCKDEPNPIAQFN